MKAGSEQGSSTNTTTPLKVGGYIRTSTRRQDLEGQRRAITEWAKRAGHELVLFEDDHVSGRRSDREGIERLLEAADGGEIKLVAVVELSRLGRSIGFVHQVIERLSKLGVNVVLVNTGTVLDYQSLEGRALVGALALAADIEWKLISERNARGRETIKARGVRVGPKALDVSTQALLALREKDLSVREIARELKVSPATVSRRLKALAIPVGSAP